MSQLGTVVDAARLGGLYSKHLIQTLNKAISEGSQGHIALERVQESVLTRSLVFIFNYKAREVWKPVQQGYVEVSMDDVEHMSPSFLLDYLTRTMLHFVEEETRVPIASAPSATVNQDVRVIRMAGSTPKKRIKKCQFEKRSPYPIERGVHCAKTI